MFKGLKQERPRPPFLEPLLAKVSLHRTTLEGAYALSSYTHKPLGASLVEMGAVEEASLHEAFCQVTDYKIWDRRGVVHKETVLPPAFLRANHILPIKRTCQKTGSAVYGYVLSDPEDEGLVDMIRKKARKGQIYLATRGDIQHFLAKHFPAASREEAKEAQAIPVLDATALKDLAFEAPIVRKVNDLIKAGVAMNASDLHIEPREEEVEVRYRVDGVLHRQEVLRMEDYPAIVSRLKILARLDIAERRRPQDGGFSLVVQSKKVDIRVSTIPSSKGEDISLRLLNPEKRILDLEALGFDKTMCLSLVQALQKSHGLILVTGPTGAGKTTTLYGGVQKIWSLEKKIVTVEDPVEYQLEGLTQVQVNEAAGLTFRNILPSILRHDPDIILIGEIRDVHTATIAAQAALTGHLVLSTLHTNSAPGALIRLLNMGVKDYIMASTIQAATSQRLVRKLCEDCKREEVFDSSVLERLKELTHTEVLERGCQAVGCESCQGIGYRGRFAIGEIFVMTHGLRQCLLSSPTEGELVQEGLKEGYRTFLDYGLAAVGRGETSLEEVLRIMG